ncbi:MAG: sulfotransferase [Planctomycetales bacterium]|nr:sulfotransferase [Planctomycetales bacterium]
MRLNRPIFLNGMSRGGTTILMNLISSHPAVALVGETHKTFKGCRQNDSVARVAYKCLFRELPVLTAHRQDYFSPRLEEPRPRLTPVLRRHVDRCLFAEQLRRHPNLNQYKAPGVKYTSNELRRARLLAKNLDGAIYLSDVFAEMYPDATFVSLIRNGFAVCEGHVRRGTPANTIGRRYRELATKMLDDAETRNNHVLIRFEDLLADAREVAVRCCLAADLDIWQLGEVRQQRRRVIRDDGQHVANGREWEVVWTPLAQLSSTLEQDIDQRQIARLSDADRDAFLEEAYPVMQRLGYVSRAQRQVRRAA